ncbi:MAG TPA: CHAD domain-containing protein [Anaerolineaceae bacterium]|nr:CHAD domain-containing protein [Anaerolineaceae bacterium]
MKVNRDIRIQKYASANILGNTQNLLAILEKIQNRYKIEDIHDLRVASRRIRTALSIFAPFFPKSKIQGWGSTIRSITSDFGKTRDLDVQIEFLENQLNAISDRKVRAGINRLQLRLIQNRKKRDRKVKKHTTSLLKSKDLNSLLNTMQRISQTPGEENYPVELYQLAFHTIYNALDQFLYYEVFIQHPENIHELHLMRIAAKKVRYTLEVFLPLYQGKMDAFLDIMKNIQQKLGAIHDCDVWITFIPEFMEAEKQRTLKYYGRSSAFHRFIPGLEFIKKDRQQERDRIYTEFMNEWQKWRSAETWLRMRELILQASVSVMDNTPINTDGSRGNEKNANISG